LIEMEQVILVIDQSAVSQLVTKGVRIEEYAILAIMSASRGLLESYMRRTADQKVVMLQPLVRKQLLDLKESDVFRLEDYSISEKGAEILALIGTGAHIVTVEKEGLDEFVQKYLELFPKGVKNGGNKPLRSNATDVKGKFVKFFQKYKHSRETVLKATEHMLERCRGVYTYCHTAEYFIMKDGSSALATECDLVQSGEGEELINPFEKRM